MLGGWDYGPLTNEIYKSSDGINWSKVANGTWQGRHGAGMIAFNNKLWVLSGDGHPDVWSSEDGIEWVLEVDYAPWGRRYTPYITVFNGKMWLMGGVSYWNETGFYSQSFEKVFNDIWSSEDGINWKLEIESAPWGPRGIIHGSLVHNGEMWILGGGSKNWNIPTNIYNDVWKSKNGIDWELVTESSPWAPRIHFTTISFDNKIWVIDGTTKNEALTNSVWYSENGIKWYPLESSSIFPPTHASTAFVHDNSLYISAGFDLDAIYRYTTPKAQSYTGKTDITVSLDTTLIDLNINLSSKLLPNISVEDTAIVELVSGKIKTKKIGNTKLTISHQGAYGFYPLEKVHINLNVKQKQNIIAEIIPEAIVQDTIKLNVITDLGLPVNIVPNDFIHVIDANTFVPLTSGTIIIKLFQEGNENYAPWSNELKINVHEFHEDARLKQKQVLLNELSAVDLVYDSSKVNLNFTSSSGLPLSLEVLDTSIAEIVQGNCIKINSAGSTKIKISNKGDNNYYPLYTTFIELNVAKREQKLLPHNSSISSIYGSSPIKLHHNSNAGLALHYDILDSDIADIINNDVLIIKNSGSTKLIISNKGDKNYLPLNPVYIDLKIQKKNQNILAHLPTAVMVMDTVFINIISDSELPVKIKSNVDITVLSEKIFIPITLGHTTIELTQEGNRNYNSWSKILDLDIHSPYKHLVYPNPAKDLVEIYSGNINLSTKIENISIYSLSGKLIKSLSIKGSTNHYILNVKELNAGTYIIKTYMNNGYLSTSRLVKL